MGILTRAFQSIAILWFGTLVAAGGCFSGTNAAASSYDFIGTGDRIELKGGDFSIEAPANWEVFTSHPSLTLVMQIPHSNDLKYQRTIQVASFGGKKYIDEVTAREFEGNIVRQFSQLSSSIEGYKIRDHQVVDMSDGRDGILFYSEFMLDDVEMMQAHILVSSDKRHYLMTFTDLADHFEKEEYSQYLNEAWSSMVSVELAGGGGASLLKKMGLGKFKRFQTLIYFVLAAISLFLLFGMFKYIRRKSTGRQFSSYTGDDGREDDEDSRVRTSKLDAHSTQLEKSTSHSQPARSKTGRDQFHSEMAPTQSRATLQSGHHSRLETAEAVVEDNGIDTLFGDEEDDDKAI